MYSNHDFGHKQIIATGEMKGFFEKVGLELTGLDRIHELSFPYRHYLSKLLKSDTLVEMAHPLTVGFFKLFQVENKMIAIGRRAA
jgi:hypothetical protein